MNPREPQNLIVLVADKDARLAMQSMLSRHQSLGIQPIAFKIEQHPDHDAGCRTKGVSYLRNTTSLYAHALLVFDHEGCGQESVDISKIEKQLDADLSNSGWGNRARTLVIKPELDIWAWSDSPHIPEALGWKESYSQLKTRLSQQGLWDAREAKPNRPKECIEWALRQSKKVRSSSIYESIASRVTLKGCQDQAFCKLVKILKEWFAEE